MTTVEEAVRTWETFRRATIAELEAIPEEKWTYRVGEGTRSVRELALHVLGSGEGFTNELLDKETSFMRLRDPEVQARLASAHEGLQTKADVIEALKSSMASIGSRLRAGSEMLSQTMQTMRGEQSRVTGLFFAAAHEMHHNGQLTVYERALGIVPALTRAAQAQRKG